MSAGFFRVHADLDREGPGSRVTTLQALALATDLPDAPLVVDAGCGPGASAVVLAEALPGSRVVAVDLHAPFVAAARARAGAAGLEDRVTAVVGDMAQLDAALREAGEEGPVDLLWSEGAAYAIGFEAALAAWHPLVRPGGVLALTEPVWRTPTVTRAARDFWEAGYPDMQPAQTRRAQAAAAGWERIGDFLLPDEAWEAYYGPLRQRVAALRPEADGDPELAAALEATEEEIALYDTGGGREAVGYLFMVLRRP